MNRTQLMMVLVLLCAGQIFAQQNGVIREVSGVVELKRAGAAAFVPAKVGDAITQDTVVSTGFKSTALIAAGSTVLTVRPLTRLTLSEISSAAGSETINVNLQAGRVRVDVNPPAGTRTNMSVRSPNATASVRGTSFEFDTRNIYVHQGTVAFQGRKGGVILVSAGSTSEIRENGKAVNPIETGAADLLPPLPRGSDSGYVRQNTQSAQPVTFVIEVGFN